MPKGVEETIPERPTLPPSRLPPERAATCVAIPDWLEKPGAPEPAPEIPRWVPSDARRTIKKLLAWSDLPHEHRAILTRLATYDRMQDVWKAVARIGGENEGSVILQALARGGQALSYKPPFPCGKKAQLKRNFDDAMALTKPVPRPLADVAAIASWLVAAMKNTAPDAKVLLASDTSASFEHLLDWATNIANVYGNLSAQQSSSNNALFPSPRIGKPAAKDAPERWFSVAMTMDFLKLYGKPLDEAVAALTDVVFNSDDVTESETIRGQRRSAERRNILAKN